MYLFLRIAVNQTIRLDLSCRISLVVLFSYSSKMLPSWGFIKKRENKGKNTARLYWLTYWSAMTPTRFDLLLKEKLPAEVLCGRTESAWGLPFYCTRSPGTVALCALVCACVCGVYSFTILPSPSSLIITSHGPLRLQESPFMECKQQ